MSNKWIPCSERQPDKNDCYLVTVRIGGGNFRGGDRDIGIRFWSADAGEWWSNQPVLAWTELPEPWEGVK